MLPRGVCGEECLAFQQGELQWAFYKDWDTRHISFTVIWQKCQVVEQPASGSWEHLLIRLSAQHLLAGEHILFRIFGDVPQVNLSKMSI